LALVQARDVRARLAAAHADLAAEDAIEIVVIKTTGDRVQDRTLSEIGGKGLFTKEIEEALLDRRIDAAVHSMKDVPTWLPDGLVIAAILPREDSRDVLLAAEATSLAALPKGSVIGTASLRRQAQVLLARPDLRVVPLRGNVETRLRKLHQGEVDATLLALAGLRRLGLADEVAAQATILSAAEMLPAAAQGAIGLEIRADDERARDIIAALDHAPSATCVAAERACLDVLDGSCRTPIGAAAEITGDQICLRALVAMPDGSRAHRAEQRGALADAVAVGRAVGGELRAAAGVAFFAALADVQPTGTGR
jgi:hydroxymethylbilane synthase